MYLRKYDSLDPDFAAEMTQTRTDDAIRDISRKAQIDPGEPGECDYCGEHSPRLINLACARCRDKYRLK